MPTTVSAPSSTPEFLNLGGKAPKLRKTHALTRCHPALKRLSPMGESYAAGSTISFGLKLTYYNTGKGSLKLQFNLVTILTQHPKPLR